MEAIGLNHNSNHFFTCTKNKLLYRDSFSLLVTESISEIFFQVASEQRLEIILKLNEKNFKISEMARDLDVTVPEVHRNFNRLQQSGLIEKKTDGSYNLTLFGKTICNIIPTISFMKNNQTYFQNHTLDNLPTKFFQRIGALANGELIMGHVKVMEKWTEIYENADDFIKNILVEASYSKDVIELLLHKLQKNVHINSIFSEDVIVTKGRKEFLQKQEVSKFIQNESIKRKMSKKIPIVVVLNEKEAGVSFLSLNGIPDLGSMLYSDNPLFYEWCSDFFDYSWKKSTRFQETKLSK